MGYLGRIHETGVDPTFSDTFAPIKDKATDDLKVILNSCSTFCGGSESAAKRGASLLKYFNAPNGAIYGADTFENSQVFDCF